MPLSPGQVLNNRYRIVKLLGQGGFGAVYRAWDTNLNGPCALKENFDASLAAQAQFQREASLLFNLRHPNLPRVFDSFSVPGQGQYLVMDYIEGEDLGQMLERTAAPLDEPKALGWISQVCDALSYLHSQTPAVIHRDLKPANIRITPHGQAMLVDFGIAKVYDPSLKTTMGARAVTPGYSPPEQYGLGSTNPQSDIYSLGATLYTLLTRQEPPASVDIVSGSAPPPALAHTINPLVSPGVSSAIEKAMQLNQAARFASAQEFKEALSGTQSSLKIQSPAIRVAAVQAAPAARPVLSPPIRQPRLAIPWKWIGVLAALAGVVIVVYVFTSLGGLQFNKAFPTETSAPVEPSPTPPGGVTMVLIPAGEFLMGSLQSESQAGSDEKPLHRVYLDDYSIDVYEVTNALFDEFVDATNHRTTAEKEGGSETYSGGQWGFVQGANWRHPQGPTSSLDGLGAHPVALVSWEDAVAYCEWREARLPSEAEWEKAARGGLETKKYPWGDEAADCTRTNYWGMADPCVSGASPVGSYPANGYGLFDMAGNVWEWVQDWYQADYYASQSTWNNPFGPAAGLARVARGGSWYLAARDVRVALRYAYTPDDRRVYVGFRCARTP